jgi:two-component system phosphate regulon sensor histidine kinase PhoR
VVGVLVVAAFDLPWWVVAGGVGLALGLALLLARRTRRQVERIEHLVRSSDPGEWLAAAEVDGVDEVDHALQTVGHQMTQLAQRQRRDTELLQQQALVLDHMHDGLMRVGPDGRIRYANVAAGTLFGGRNPTGRSFISVTRDHELNQALWSCLESGTEQQHTVEIPGDSRLISVVIVRLGAHARVHEALVMLRDITEVNRLQTLRRDFVANVSHELRTPLSTIKILTESLIDMNADEETGDFLRKIDGEVDSMTALVRDLLDLTRLETLGGGLATRAIDVTQLVEDVCDRMRPFADRHDVALVKRVEDNAGSTVADERRLHQALVNLINNAIVHTPAGGEVTIGADRLEDGVSFFVRDTGSGIPPDHLQRVWERFFKTDRARSGPGTGLGLAIVKHIAQAHHGRVSATSEYGRGSEFRVFIPDGLPLTVRVAAEPAARIAPN